MPKGRGYSDTYKQTIVERVLGGTKVSEIHKETKVSVATIHKWVTEYEQGQRERPATREELAEIRRLKKALAYAEGDIEILKKASALLAARRQ